MDSQEGLDKRTEVANRDAHLGNVMVRRLGRRVSVRLIDPNPNIGFSQHVYDYGKVLLALTPAGLVGPLPRRVARYGDTGRSTGGGVWIR